LEEHCPVFLRRLQTVPTVFPGVTGLPCKVEASKGIRQCKLLLLACNLGSKPSWFVYGSGLPMRFADTDGSLIDCYQAPTQITDESGLNISNFVINY
jgi:hypothetical protein